MIMVIYQIRKMIKMPIKLILTTTPLWLVLILSFCHSYGKMNSNFPKSEPYQTSYENNFGTIEQYPDTLKLIREIPKELITLMNNQDIQFPFLSKYYPGWYNFYDEIKLPYYDFGDFNGDNRRDYCIIGEKSNKFFLFYFLQKENGNYDLHQYQEVDVSYMDDKEVIPVGLATIKNIDNILNLNLKTSVSLDAVEYNIFETSSFIIYWNGFSFQEIILSD